MAGKLFRAQTILLVVMAILYALGLWLQLFWMFWWYDVMMHFLGGAWIALAARSTLVAAGREPPASWLFAIMLFVSVVWEVFEVLLGVDSGANYWLDTSVDLLMDTLGCALIVFLRRTSRESTKNT